MWKNVISCSVVGVYEPFFFAFVYFWLLHVHHPEDTRLVSLGPHPLCSSSKVERRKFASIVVFSGVVDGHVTQLLTTPYVKRYWISAALWVGYPEKKIFLQEEVPNRNRVGVSICVAQNRRWQRGRCKGPVPHQSQMNPDVMIDVHVSIDWIQGFSVLLLCEEQKVAHLISAGEG